MLVPVLGKVVFVHSPMTGKYGFPGANIGSVSLFEVFRVGIPLFCASPAQCIPLPAWLLAAMFVGLCSIQQLHVLFPVLT